MGADMPENIRLGSTSLWFCQGKSFQEVSLAVIHVIQLVLWTSFLLYFSLFLSCVPPLRKYPTCLVLCSII